MTPPTECFTVVRAFRDGSEETVRSAVDAEEAVRAAYQFCGSVSAQRGITQRIYIRDAREIVFDWQHGRGIVFPPECHGLSSALD